MVEGWLLGLLPLTLLGDSDLESVGDEAGLRSGEAAAATEVTGGDCDVTGASVEMGGVLIGVRGGGGLTKQKNWGPDTTPILEASIFFVHLANNMYMYK